MNMYVDSLDRMKFCVCFLLPFLSLCFQCLFLLRARHVSCLVQNCPSSKQICTWLTINCLVSSVHVEYCCRQTESNNWLDSFVYVFLLSLAISKNRFNVTQTVWSRSIQWDSRVFILDDVPSSIDRLRWQILVNNEMSKQSNEWLSVIDKSNCRYPTWTFQWVNIVDRDCVCCYNSCLSNYDLSSWLDQCVKLSTHSNRFWSFSVDSIGFILIDQCEYCQQRNRLWNEWTLPKCQNFNSINVFACWYCPVLFLLDVFRLETDQIRWCLVSFGHVSSYSPTHH
jgi:hypothetical protein